MNTHSIIAGEQRAIRRRMDAQGEIVEQGRARQLDGCQGIQRSLRGWRTLNFD